MKLELSATDAVREVPRTGSTVFTWSYGRESLPRVANLYDRATGSQWRSEDLPWATEVDPERVAAEIGAAQELAGGRPDVSRTPLELWSDREWLEFGVESQRWTLSQFLHGEQGALVCTAKLVESVPDVNAKFFAATQVMDEARHTEVFAKYLHDKMGGSYPITGPLAGLLDDILTEPRWDMTYLGMQVMVEGLALAAFGLMRQVTTEPLLAQMLRYVMADEARHVAFGTLALAGVYDELTDAEVAERCEFTWETALALRDRFTQRQVWERMGVRYDDIAEYVEATPARDLFRQLLFSRIVPNCSKLGLLDRNRGWLRNQFDSIGVLGFEHVSFDDELTPSELNSPAA